MLIALPGSRGTASEVQLAARYNRPLIAYVRTASDIPDLSTDIPATTDLHIVQRFVLDTLSAGKCTASTPPAVPEPRES